MSVTRPQMMIGFGTVGLFAPIPFAHWEGGMAYDSAHDQIVFYGGATDFAGISNETWTLNRLISDSAGNPQSTSAGSPFPFPLEVTAVDANGNPATTPVTFNGPAGQVTFGASMPIAVGSDGRARTGATASSVAGSYTVTASNAAQDFAVFVLSNVNTNPATSACQVRTPLDDNSTGSLRSQVATCGKGGTITFATGLTRVILTQLEDIQLTQDLTIDGGSGVTIDANSLSRIFFIFGGNIALKNLTLQNGLAKGAEGGLTAGGGAGMGGAIFVNGGAVSISNVNFIGNAAVGGNGGSPLGTAGGGGMAYKGGGGRDFGSSAGSGLDGSGGLAPNVNGGFGGGAAAGGTGGFGGGGNGTFGGASLTSGPGQSTGGGAGLGGAIFVRNGSVLFSNTTFSLNSANRGRAGTSDAANGQAKGGALFVNSGASATYTSAIPTFTNNSAPDAGLGTLCNSVVGSNAQDTKDVCGILGKFQSITFNGLSNQIYGTAPVIIGASASSGLAVSFSSLTPAVCSVNATAVTLAASGNCKIQASQAGDSTFAAAAPVTQSFQILPGSQNITFNPVADQIVGAALTLSPTSSSSLPVGLASNTPSICSVSGNSVTLLAQGLCTMQATQNGNANYVAATAVSQSFQILANVSSRVQVTQVGFARNRATGLWATTMTVTNTSAAAIAGPIQVQLTNISTNATMANAMGTFNGSPYITVTTAPLAPGGSAGVIIQFTNPSNAFISFTPVTYSGAF